MSYAEKLVRLAYLALIALILAAGGLGLWHAVAPTPVDPRTGTSGIAVETDAETGCDYIVTPWGGIVARLGADGKPVCRPPSH